MQRCGVELGEYEDLVDSRVQAVADRDVDETILAADGDCRLGALLRQREQSLTLSSSENDTNDPIQWRQPSAGDQPMGAISRA
jgi:porphobilinogen deaminase